MIKHKPNRRKGGELVTDGIPETEKGLNSSFVRFHSPKFFRFSFSLLCLFLDQHYFGYMLGKEVVTHSQSIRCIRRSSPTPCKQRALHPQQEDEDGEPK